LSTEFGNRLIDDMQFGFVKGKGTTDAIFMARQMQENFRVKDKKVSWAMRKLGVSAVMSMYTGAKTVVTRVYANSKSFEVKVGYAPRFSIKSTVIRNCHGGHI